jgi:hypothetical protein
VEFGPGALEKVVAVSVPSNPFEGRRHGDVQRDRQWIEREYGREKWPAILREAQRLLAAGETRLGAVAWQLTTWEYGDDVGSNSDITVLGERTRLPTVSAIAGFYELISSAIARACRADTGAILDMGAGWGRCLFFAWQNGAPANARYGCLEYTASGREAALALARLEPRMKFDAQPFDLHAPDLSHWQGTEGHVVAFSVYAIDQVPRINATLFDELLALAPAVDVIHVEPVGWQCRRDIGYPDSRGSSEAYAVQHDTNRNLWPTLKALADSGRIEIVQAIPDAYGLNPENTASVIHWRKR